MGLSRSAWVLRLLVFVVACSPFLLLAPPSPVQAAGTFPAGFDDALVASVTAPTALAFTPDGRLLLTSQRGQLYVKRGDAAAVQVLDLPNICTVSERGLLGVAVDPAFTSNRSIYLYYTHTVGGNCAANVLAANRVSRFTLGDDDAVTGETVLLDNIASPAGNHNGGDLHFGKDRYLYVSVGDGGSTSETAQQLYSLNGKILRIARDGTIPPSNPFTGANSASCATAGGTSAGQVCREIYAYGLRNPFRIAFDPNASGTRFFIDDVGQNTWEEIDQGQAGANYGWNVREGHCANGSTTNCGAPPAGMTNPLYDYGRDTGCASITGGAFVPNGAWPAEYAGTYLFSDYVCGKIFVLKQGAGGAWGATTFVSGLGSGSVVHLSFGPYCNTQALYYTTYAGGGQIRRLSYGPGVNCGAVSPFSDVAPGDPGYEAIRQLAMRDIIKGYTAEGCAALGVAYPCFGPGQTSLRAQMAALIVRSMGWSGESATNPFTDDGGIAPELWNSVAILAAHDVAFGYGGGRFGPNDMVSQSQVASFIARAMVEKGFWQPALVDDPAIYPNVPASTGQRLDLVTFVQNAGALPDQPAGAAWAGWSDPATRAWFARALWQALGSRLGPPQ